MKSGNEDGDEDFLDDPIQLNFGENSPPISNLQFLDPGIIDLDCDSDEDVGYNKGTPDTISLLREVNSILPVTAPISNSIIVKPMRIKLVDCYKFPWYFDQFTKNIIHKKLAFDKSVNIDVSEEKKYSSFKDLRNETDDGNEIKDSQIDVHSIDDEFKTKTNSNSNNPKDMNRIREIFNTNMRITSNSLRLAKYKQRTDMELLNALSQRNKTGVDFKKNTGLVGMKILHLTTERRIGIEIKDRPGKNTITNKEINLQEATNKLYMQAKEFEKSEESAKGSKFSKCRPQDFNADSSVKLSKITCNLQIPIATEIDKNVDDSICTSNQRHKEKRNIVTKANDPRKIAEEIVQRVTYQNEEKDQTKEKYLPSGDINKLHKAPSNLKITENEKNKMCVKENAIQQQKKYADGCKMTKMITPLPLSPKVRNKKQFNNVERSKGGEICEKNESKLPIASSSMFEKYNLTKVKNKSHDIKNVNQRIEYDKTNDIKYAYHNKSFSNRFTENILNKIRAKQQKLTNMNRTNELHKKHDIKSSNSNQTKSIDKYKSNQSLSISKTNVTNKILKDKIIKNVKPLSSTLDETVQDISAKRISDDANSLDLSIIVNEIQHLNKNDPDISPRSNKNNLQFSNQIAENTLPLNTTIVKASKRTDVASNIPVQKAQTNNTNINNLVHESNTVTGQLSAEKSELTDEEFVKNKGNSKFMDVSAPPANSVPQTIKEQNPIQTIVTSRNASDTGKTTHKAANLSFQYHTPNNTQASTILLRPTLSQNFQDEQEAQMKNKPLNVHNSMQSHILYRPHTRPQPPPQMYPNTPGTFRYQVPMHHMNQGTCHQPNYTMQYPPSYPAGTSSHNITRPYSVNAELLPQMGFNIRPLGMYEGNPRQMAMNTSRPPVGGNNRIQSQSSMNAGIYPGFPSLLTMTTRPPFGGYEGFFPQTTVTIKPPRENAGYPSQMTKNTRTSLNDNGEISPQITINVRPPGPNGVISMPMNIPSSLGDKVVSQQTTLNVKPGINAGFPPQIVSNNRFCDEPPGNFIWSHAFPPPKLPPPPPPPPPTSPPRQPPPPPPPYPLPPSAQQLSGSQFKSEDSNSSVIGRNHAGIIKKITITAPVIDQNTKNSTENFFKIEKFDLDHAPLKDEKPIVSPSSSSPALTKSELFKHLYSSSQQINSPVEHLERSHPRSLHESSDKFKRLPAEPNGSRNLLTIESKTKPGNISNNRLSQQNVQSIKTNGNFKTTIPIKTSFNHEVNVKVPPPYNSSDSVASNLNNYFDLFDDSFTNFKAAPNKSDGKLAVTTRTPPFTHQSKNNPRPVNLSTKSTPKEFELHSKVPPVISKEVSVNNSKAPMSGRIVEQTEKSATDSKGMGSICCVNNFERVIPDKPSSNTVSFKRDSNVASSANIKRPQPINEVLNLPSTAKYKAGPLSKKPKLNDQRETSEQTKPREFNLVKKGCSPPILLIPNLEQNLSEISTPCSKLFETPCRKKFSKKEDYKMENINRNVNLSTKKRKLNSLRYSDQTEQNNRKVESGKKISLHEYKKRSASERKLDEEVKAKNKESDVSLKKETDDMQRRASNVDSDLGYDSDVTVKL